MAKKINVKLIMELRDTGLPRNMIAATRHMSKNSVGDVIHIADQKGITFSDVRGLDEDAGPMSILWTKKVERLCCFF